MSASGSLRRRAWQIGLLGFALVGPFSISGAQISLGIALLALIAEVRAGTVRPALASMEAPFGLLLVAAVLSLGNAVDLGRGVAELRKFLLLLVFWIPFWLPVTGDWARRTVGVLIGSSAVVGVLGTVKTLAEMQSLQQRAAGFFSMSLTFGEYQALVLMTTLIWLHVETSPRVRRWLWAAICCQGLGLLASMARGALLGLGLGCLFLWRTHWRGFLAVVIVLGLGLSAFLLTAQDEDSRFFAVRKHDWVRFRIWQIGFGLIAEKPVFGVGMNNIKPLYKERVTPEELEKKWVFGHQHNNFMQYLVMTGLFGFTAFCWWLVELGRFCLWPPTSGETWKDGMRSGLFALFVCFWGSGFTEYSFGDEEVAMLFFFLLGLLANQHHNEAGVPKA